MSKPIEGKVAQILSESLLIINVGADAGVRTGLALVVIAQGEEVKDPETGEVLGRWEIPKGYVRATHVQDRLSTCEGFTPGREDAKGDDPSTNVLSAALIAHSMRPETWRRTSGAKLNVNRAEIAGMPATGPISVGDVVRELLAEPPAAEAPEPPKDEKPPEPAGDAGQDKAPDK